MEDRKRTWNRAGARGVLALLCLMTPVLSGCAGTAHAVPRDQSQDKYNLDYSAEGRSGTYNVLAHGVDLSTHPGVVFFFDGDYDDPSDSRARNARTDADIQGMAADAAKHQMIFVVMDTPAPSSDEGYTWWVQGEQNGKYARNLARHLISQYHADDSKLWFSGWSGGSDFVTDQLLADDTSWIHGGGATLSSGGENLGFDSTPPQSTRDLKITWHEGEKDIPSDGWHLDLSDDQRSKNEPGKIAPDSGTSSDDDPGWSGYGAGAQGYAAYRKEGYDALRFESVPDAGHTDIDLPGVLREDLNRDSVK